MRMIFYSPTDCTDFHRFSVAVATVYFRQSYADVCYVFVRFVKFVFEKYSCSSAWKIICANLEWNLWENKINHQWEYVS